MTKNYELHMLELLLDMPFMHFSCFKCALKTITFTFTVFNCDVTQHKETAALQSETLWGKGICKRGRRDISGTSHQSVVERGHTRAHTQSRST